MMKRIAMFVCATAVVWSLLWGLYGMLSFAVAPRADAMITSETEGPMRDVVLQRLEDTNARAARIEKQLARDSGGGS